MTTQKKPLNRLIVTALPLLFIVSCETTLIDRERGDYLKIPVQDSMESSSEAAFWLVDEDLPVILLSDDPTHSAIIAARELQIHMKEILGAYPEVGLATDRSIDLETKRIYVGMSGAGRDSGIPNTFEPEQYVKIVNPNSIFLVGQDDESVRATDLFSLSDRETGKALVLDGQTLYSTEKFDNEGFNSRGGSIAFWVWIPDDLDTTQVVISMGRHLISISPFPANGSGDEAKIEYVVYQSPPPPNEDSDNQNSTDSLATKVTSDPVTTDDWYYVSTRHEPSSDLGEPDGQIELCIKDVSCKVSRAINDDTNDESILLIGGWGEKDTDRFEGRIDSLRIASLEPQGQALKATPTHQTPDSKSTYLVSMDFDEPFHVPLNKGRFEKSILPLLESIHHNHGTLLAAYEFLEKDLQVGWYAPTEVGTSIIKNRKIGIPCGTVIRKPAMEYRLFAAPQFLLPPNYDENHPEGIAISQYEQELFRYRMRLGGKSFNAIHAFRGYRGEFGSDSSSASWFANDKRQMCYLNKGLRDQIVTDAVDYFNWSKIPDYIAGVGGDCFSITPNDVPLLNEPGCNQVAKNTSDLYSNDTASQMIWEFANEIATEVYERLEPEVQESARVCMAAYKQYAYPPEGKSVHPMITPKIALVYPRSEYSQEVRDNDLEILRAWRKALGPDRTMYVHFYYLTPVLAAAKKNYFPFPGITPRSTVALGDLLLTEYDVSGYYIEHSSQGKLPTAAEQYPYEHAENPENPLYHASYLIDQVDLYLFSRLAFDPTADGEALIEEFFDRYYHEASDAMRSFYYLLEDTYIDSQNYVERESLEKTFTSNHYYKKLRCCVNSSDDCHSCADKNKCLPYEDAYLYSCIRQHCYSRSDTEFCCVFENGKPYGIGEINDWKNVGTESVMRQLSDYLLDATDSVAEDPIARERVDLFATTVWCPMVNEYNLAASTHGRPNIEDTDLCRSSTVRKMQENE